MIITCNTNNLNKAISTAQRAISSKPSTPIFSGMHLLAKENFLILQAMDINLAISCAIEADIELPGEIVVSAKHFSELVRKLSSDTITLTKNKENNSLKITSGNSEFQLLLMNEEDYPKFPSFDADKSVTIKEEKIKNLIKKTIFACSNDEARPLFTGILIEAKDNKLTFVGTNTHRLSIKSTNYEASEPLSIIIPAKVLNEISRNLTSEIPQDVKISLLNNQLMITIDNTIIISRLIEGKFPDYNKVIPSKFTVTCKVNSKELANAVDRVALFSEGEYSIVKINVNNNMMTLTSSSPNVGNGREVIPCVSEGDSLNVAFNAQYLVDVLKVTDAEEITFEMNTSLSPVCLKSEQEPDYIYIVTPVRVVF